MAILPEYTVYTNCILKHLSMNDMYFKRDPDYQYVLEHVDENEANIYFQYINNKFYELFNKNKEYLIDLCNKNDRYGKPITKIFTNFTQCSPTNIRYIYHSFMILDFIKKNNYNNINLIEIGGGYGGLCLFINSISKIFNITIDSYTIFDLKEASLLQEKYLKLNNIQNFKTAQIYNYDINSLNEKSCLISNYAYSEISSQLQKEYTNKILNPFTIMGFLTWNFVPVYNFVNGEIKVYDEKNAKYVTYIKF
jgi:hypothetical protein